MTGFAARLPAAGWRTRFAPAPTGFLHLGHLVNAMHVWGIARAFGGRVVLRIEDHDRTRCRPEFESALLEDLEWMGFVPDEGDPHSYRTNGGRARGGVPHPLRQSDNDARYLAALDALDAAGRVYACECTRRDIARLVPRVAGEEARYPGTCRHRGVDRATTPARRVLIDDTTEQFIDLRLGPMQQTPAAQCGDVLARDRHGSWTYQFSVVVDDIAQGIDVVIRGEDLLSSTGRQLQIARLLGRATPPAFLHHILLRHPDGSKLSKSSHDTALRERREAGATPEQLLGEAAALAGLTKTAQPLAMNDVVSLFALPDAE